MKGSSARTALVVVVVVVALVVALIGGEACAPAPHVAGAAWNDADALFRRAPRLLGADSAYSVALPGDRVLWLFGDTFVATSDALSRDESLMVRNSVAIQRGLDPTTAELELFVRGTDTEPSSFFPERGDRWFWPGTPAMVEDKLLLFLWRMKPSDGGFVGFAYDGGEAVLVDNPEADPPDWVTTAVDVPALPDGFALGTGGAMVDGGTLFLLSTREPGDHRMGLAVLPVVDAARGDLSKVEWKGDAGFNGQTELSLSRFYDGFAEVQLSGWGFGALPIGVRTAPGVDGPWSDEAIAFEPPERERDGVFVYSAKAHPELRGADGDLVVTYCSNAYDFADLVADDSIYFPRFVRITAR